MILTNYKIKTTDEIDEIVIRDIGHIVYGEQFTEFKREADMNCPAQLILPTKLIRRISCIS